MTGIYWGFIWSYVETAYASGFVATTLALFSKGDSLLQSFLKGLVWPVFVPFATAKRIVQLSK